MKLSRTYAVALVATLGIAAAAGCGGGGNAGGGGGSSATSSGSGTTAAPASLTISGGSTFNFNIVAVGASADNTFTVTNGGGQATASLSASALSAPYSYKGGTFPGTGGTCGASVATGASCTFVVTFSPSSATTSPATLTLSYGDGTGATQTASVTLSGTGANIASLQMNNGSTYAFGTVANNATVNVSITLRNVGTVQATSIDGSSPGLTAPIQFEGGGGYPGTAGGNCGATLNAGSSCTLTLSLAPTTTGSYPETLTIGYNNSVATTQATLNITAASAPPAVLTVSDGPGTFSYGTIANTSSLDHTFTITNTGGVTATGLGGSGLSTPFKFKGGGGFPGTGGTCGTTLAAGSGNTCTFVVTFSSSSTYQSQPDETINIAYNDGTGSQSVTRNVNGTSLPPAALTISDGEPYNFGQVATGTINSHTFTVTNSGGVSATGISQSSISSPFSYPGGYPGTGGTCASTLPATGGSNTCTIVVHFLPTVPGVYDGTSTSSFVMTLTYNNGALGGQTAVKQLQGTDSAAATWISGTNDTNNAGTYGTKGTGSTSNVPPSRDQAVSWKDNSGNFWLFGGQTGSTSAGLLNDLWEYSPSTSKWTWVSGAPVVVLAAASVTISNSSTSMTVSSATGIFQGQAISGTHIPAGATVTNVSGTTITMSASATGTSSGNYIFTGIGVYGTKNVANSANVPGARHGAAGWTDGNNLFLFGGQGYDTNGALGSLNDLWKFDGANWTWISGDNVKAPTLASCSSYGTRGTAASGNKPGGRLGAIGWIDGSNNGWLFGGSGCDSTGSAGQLLSDLWEYTPGTGNWTWVSGSSVAAQYGTYSGGAASLEPGGRQFPMGWIDASNNIWIFGGSGLDDSGGGLNNPADNLNDLWEYSPGTGNWTFASGTDRVNNDNPIAGLYGTIGVTAGPGTNLPGGRQSGVTWLDGNGRAWLFGGSGYDVNGNPGQLNDLWKWDGANWTWVMGADTVTTASTYGSEGTPAFTNVLGSRKDSVGWIDSSGALWLFGGRTGTSGPNLSDLWKIF
jgi:N-acetylneuraminic acid mutarotase